MNKFIEKLIGRLEEEKSDWNNDYNVPINKAIEIINELAEEYKDINIITNFLQYVRDNADNYDADNGWSLSDLIDLSIKFCDAEEYNGGWIPCSERLPEDDTMCVVYTNTKEYFLSWFEDGKWVYDNDEYGIIDFFFNTESFYVVEWQPLHHT